MVQDQYGILVSLSSKHSTVPYDLLMSAIGIANERDLEDFIIQAIYQDIIQGRLNPMNRALEITDWNSNRLGDSDLQLQFMIETLIHWRKHCNEFVNTLASQVDNSNKLVSEFADNEKRVNESMTNIKKALSIDELGNPRKIWTASDRGEPSSGPGTSGSTKANQKPETKRFKSGPAKKKGGNN